MTRRLGRVAVLGALTYVGTWLLATLLRPGSWRYDISDLYAVGAPRPWLVMVGEVTFSIALAALALGLRRALPPSDHRLVGCALLALASIGTAAGALARNACESSVPRCAGSTFVTAGDWVHATGGLVEILGIVGAALVLATTLPRPWTVYCLATGGATLLAVFAWAVVPYPWVGTAQRVMALLLVAWVAAMGARLLFKQPSSPSISKLESPDRIVAPGAR